MDSVFHKIDIDNWDRKEEYQFFMGGGCSFTMNADVDITNLYNFAHSHNIKLYPLLVACMINVINGHKEFKYGWSNGDFESGSNEFGYYDTVHPLFFDLMPNGNTKCLCAEYNPDILKQVEEIERVRKAYENINTYRPQKDIPTNVINISCVPWVNFNSVSFCLKYCAEYYPPMMTFGKFVKSEGKVIIPLSVYCNHAVNDGHHASIIFTEFQQLADSLK